MHCAMIFPTRWMLIGLLLSTVLLEESMPLAAQNRSAEKWEPDIQRFEKQDRKQPPEPGGILFIGSSSIRLWDLEKWFPGMGAVNRGFGGCETSDCIHYFDRIVMPHRPRMIVFFAGTNDLSHGELPTSVHQDFLTFCELVHEKLPDAKIAHMAITLTESRWHIADRVRATNALARMTCAEDERLTFISTASCMTDAQGFPPRELFRDDLLHLNDNGYALWTALLRPTLVEHGFKPSP